MAVLRPSSAASVFARSSHLLLTLSRLLPTRCVGVHLLVAVGVELAPVGVDKILPVRCEVLRDKDPWPDLEEVRSSRRVWYAKGAADEDAKDLEPDKDGSERSILSG